MLKMKNTLYYYITSEVIKGENVETINVSSNFHLAKRRGGGNCIEVEEVEKLVRELEAQQILEDPYAHLETMYSNESEEEFYAWLESQNKRCD